MGKYTRIATKARRAKRGNTVSYSRKSEPAQSGNSSVDRILHLQRTVGNQAVQRMIQAEAIQANHKIGRSQLAPQRAYGAGVPAKEDAKAKPQPPPVDFGQPVTRASEQFYPIAEPALAGVPNHFRFVDDQGQRWAGETEAVIGGADSLSPKQEGQNLIVRNIPWNVQCVVHLPRWENFAQASAVDQQKWARFMRAVRVHEQGHVDRAYQFIQQLPPTDRQVSGATLPAIQANLAALGARLGTRLQTQHDTYDLKTGHGATQGAVL